jgi:hypothetical protein
VGHHRRRELRVAIYGPRCGIGFAPREIDNPHQNRKPIPGSFDIVRFLRIAIDHSDKITLVIFVHHEVVEYLDPAIRWIPRCEAKSFPEHPTAGRKCVQYDTVQSHGALGNVDGLDALLFPMGSSYAKA